MANVRSSSAPAQPDQEALSSIREIISYGLHARATAVLQYASGERLPPVERGQSQLPPIMQRVSGGTLSTLFAPRRRPSNVGDWSNADVCDWLKEIGFTGEQVELCVQHSMRGTTLLGAPIEEIHDMLSIRRLGARKRTQALIGKLRLRNLADCRAPLPSIPLPPGALGLSI